MGTSQPAHEIHELWRRATPILRQTLGDAPFRSWISGIEPGSADAAMIVLVCTSPFHRDTVLARYGKTITDLLAFLSKMEREVEFVVGPEARPAALRTPEPVLVEGSVKLDRASTFETFIAGSSNLTAFHIAQGVANGTEICANPLFIFGPTGVGKTHLLHSIVRRMLEREPGKRVLFLTVEGFLQQFVTSLKTRETQAFKDLVRGVDVLVCDDLQFLAGKTATAEEFFFSLDDLVGRGKAVILTADGSPSLMQYLPDRLRSRLMSGGGVEIAPPDLDLRLELLRSFARRRAQELPGFVLGDDVLRMIAGRLRADGRILAGAIKRLETRWRHENVEVTFERAEIWLEDFLRAHNKKITLNEIKAQVAAFYRVKISEIESTCRRREFVRPRQVAMYLSRMLTQRSYPEIGRSYKRDHTTIMHGFDRITTRRAIEPDLAAEIEAIERSIRESTSEPPKSPPTN